MKMDLPGDNFDQSPDRREPGDVLGSIGPDGLAGRGAAGGKRLVPQVLIVASGAERRAALSRAIRGQDVLCRLADTERDAIDLVRRDSGDGMTPFEAVVLDTERCGADALRFIKAMGDRHIATVIVCPNVSFDEAVEAMRAGACDIVSSTVKPVELQRRIRTAIAQSRSQQEAFPGAAGRLGAVPQRSGGGAVGPTGRPRATKIGSGTGLGTGAGSSSGAAPSDAGSAVGPRAIAGIVSDFGAMVRQELDVETLLRQSLEFVLQQGGPTNAAVFLPGTTGDYALGAYVNFSCPKDTAEVMLDHLANVAAPRLEHIRELAHCRTPGAIREAIGDGSHWVEDGEMVAFTCRSGGEALAIFVLFRDRTNPFSDHFRKILSKIAPVFGEQLARVVRIHHRHLPHDQWGNLGDGPLTDDETGGGGGLAA